MAPFPLIYCLFMFQCFDIKHGEFDLIMNKSGTGNFRCPAFCSCYRAPKENFSAEMSSFSMICDNSPTQKLPPPNPNGLLAMNIVVFSGTTVNAMKWILKNFLPISIVVSSFSETDELFFPTQTLVPWKVRYLTFFKVENVNFAQHTGSEQIHIEKCSFHSLGFHLSKRLIPSTNVLFIEQKYPNLRSLTIKSSKLDTVVMGQKGFLLDSPLEMIDFSFNKLLSVDFLIENTHHPKAYPGLKIVHLYNNDLVRFLPYILVKSLSNIGECLLFTSAIKSKIYYTEQLKSLANIEHEHINTLALVDSLVHSVSYECDENSHFSHQSYTPWKDLTSTKEKCSPMKYQPGRIYSRDDSEQFLLGAKDDIVLTGESYSFGESTDERMNIDEEYSLARIVIDELLIDEPHYSAVALLKRTLLTNRKTFFLLAVQRYKRLPEANLNGILPTLEAIPSVLGYSPIFIDSKFAGIKLNIQGPDVCPIVGGNDFGLLEVLIIYHNFFQKLADLEYPMWESIRTLQIDFECLHLLQLILNTPMLKACDKEYPSMEGFELTNAFQVNAIDIVLKVPAVKLYEEQLRQLRQYKAHLFAGKPLFLTFREKPTVLQKEAKMFEDITKNVISDMFISDQPQ